MHDITRSSQRYITASSLLFVRSFRVGWVEQLEDRVEDLRAHKPLVRLEKIDDWFQECIKIHNDIINDMRRKSTPLPIKNGLNPTRIRVQGAGLSGIRAADAVAEVIFSQRHRHPDDDWDAIHQRFDAGGVVRHNGSPLHADDVLAENTEVFFYKIPAPETAVPYRLSIVHQDDDLLVVHKPPFMATMPRARHIVQTATVQLRRATGIAELSPAHRLDRLTSGLVVFTTRPELRGAYQTLFAQRRVSKVYEAIAAHNHALAHQLDQALDDARLTWRSRLEKNPGELQGRFVEGEPNAITHLEAVTACSPAEQAELEKIHGPQPPLARYRLAPVTGKTHQLRLHMWAAGVPILGDPVYPRIYREDEEDFAVPMHLIAREISFQDPLSGEQRSFRTDLGVLDTSCS